MGKARKPRLTWNERSDQLEGIRRDKATGIVIAREHTHPLADWFRSVPMGVGNVGMQMPIEYCHLFAIHVFDNLQLPAPTRPLYKPRRDPNSRREAGIDAVLWVPVGTPDEDILEDVTEKPIVVADVTGYTPEQMAAMKVQIRQEEIRQKLIQQSDTGETGETGTPP